MKTLQNQPSKNIVICLDGTGNQFSENLSNVVKLYRMLERELFERLEHPLHYEQREKALLNLRACLEFSFMSTKHTFMITLPCRLAQQAGF